ncbi:MAG: rhodanese-like domain-containing protein [Smithellaceae bacterium]|nr:rhodanese-like domain-containing protein [Smithellaceae bacterium]
MKRGLVWIVSVMFVLSVAGVALAQTTGTPLIVREMVAKAKEEIQRVTAADVKAALDNKEKAIILDVRDKEEYDAGYIPGAINVSRGKLEFRVMGAIPDLNAKVYVYCLTAARSALATKTMMEMGYKNVVQMDAPFEAWTKAGYPVEKK